jgi:hypothetical protein
VQATLSASVEAEAGAIEKAKVSFIDLSSGKVLASGVPVSPVAGSTTPSGTANTMVTLSTGQYGLTLYMVQVKLDTASGSSYHNTAQLSDPTSAAYATVAVSLPPTSLTTRGSLIAGTGMAQQSSCASSGTTSFTSTAYGLPCTAAGVYGAATEATYGVSLKYNKSGASPQGAIQLQLVTDPDGDGPLNRGLYTIKSNSITSFAFNGAGSNSVTVNTKASIFSVDLITGTSTSVEGNVSLRMDAFDGGTTDNIGFTVLSSKDSKLFYSNNWQYNATAKAWRTAPQQVTGVAGGAVQVTA